MLLGMGCTNADIEALERKARMTLLIDKLRTHGGLFTSDEEIKEFLRTPKEKGTTAIKLATMLNDEI